jgi:hypothetical protein
MENLEESTGKAIPFITYNSQLKSNFTIKIKILININLNKIK